MIGGEASPGERDELFQALADDRRQLALRCLAESDRPLALADLARMVASREPPESPTEPPHERTKSVYLSLYHRHVPRLADADLITYDRDHEMVGPGDRFGAVRSLFTEDRASDD